MDYYTTDHLGSVRVITDMDGSIQKCFDYLPHGGICQNPSLDVANPGESEYLHRGNGRITESQSHPTPTAPEIR